MDRVMVRVVYVVKYFCKTSIEHERYHCVQRQRATFYLVIFLNYIFLK